MARKPSQKQLENWISGRLKTTQSKRLSEEKRQYYKDTTLGKLTSEMFEKSTYVDRWGNIRLRKKKGQDYSTLEHMWNIMKKTPTTSKLSQRKVERHFINQGISETFDHLYKNLTESEVHALLPERNDKGQFSQEDIQRILDYRNNNGNELQEMVDEWIDDDEYFFI